MREEGRVFTYGEIEDRTARVASALLAAGLKMGDRIAWIGKNSDLYFTLFFGAARAGIVMAPIGWRLSPAEWAFIVTDRSEEHTSELQSLMRIPYADFCLQKQHASRNIRQH